MPLQASINPKRNLWVARNPPLKAAPFPAKIAATEHPYMATQTNNHLSRLSASEGVRGSMCLPSVPRQRSERRSKGAPADSTQRGGGGSGGARGRTEVVNRKHVILFWREEHEAIG